MLPLGSGLMVPQRCRHPNSRACEYVILHGKRALRLLIHKPRGREIILDYLGEPILKVKAHFHLQVYV